MDQVMDLMDTTIGDNLTFDFHKYSNNIVKNRTIIRDHNPTKSISEAVKQFLLGIHDDK